MSEQSSQSVPVSGHASSPRFSIYEQPLTETEYPVPKSHSGHTMAKQEPEAKTEMPCPSPQPDAHLGRSLAQILVVLVVLLVLVNIPINYQGASLAQIRPDATAMVLYDGLVLKGSGPEIYVLEGYKLRRIGSPEAFEYYFRQYQVQVVEDNLLEDLGEGQPIRRLVSCQGSPYVYALEHGRKRWVKDPPTQDQAKPWDEVHLVSCDYLRGLPEGPPIQENAAPPP